MHFWVRIRHDSACEPTSSILDILGVSVDNMFNSNRLIESFLRVQSATRSLYITAWFTLDRIPGEKLENSSMISRDIHLCPVSGGFDGTEVQQVS